MCSLHLMKPLPLLSLRSLACQLKLSCSQARLDSWTSLIALGRFFASKASKDDEPEQEPTLSMKQPCPPRKGDRLVV